MYVGTLANQEEPDHTASMVYTLWRATTGKEAGYLSKTPTRYAIQNAICQKIILETGAVEAVNETKAPKRPSAIMT
jgi:hypothetical protein